MNGTVLGINFKVGQDPEKYPELKDRIEEMGRVAFTDRYDFAPTSVTWAYHAPYLWTDPETGEEVEMPEMWMCLIEGMKP